MVHMDEDQTPESESPEQSNDRDLQPPAGEPEGGQSSEPNFKLVRQGPLPEDSFADGAAGISASRNVIKLDLYRVIGVDQDTRQELRTISHRIVLPLVAVPELMQLLHNFGAAVRKQDKLAKVGEGPK